MTRLGNWALPGVVILSIGLGALIAQAGGYPTGRMIGSFLILGLGLYFMLTIGHRQFPWPLFMILPAAYSLVHVFGWLESLPAGALGYGTLIIIGVWLLVRPRKDGHEEDE